MDKKENLIEKYLLQELSETEVAELNALLESDTDFKDEFELRTIMYADYKEEVKQSLRKIAFETSNDTSSQATSDTSGTSWIWKLTLLIGLLAIAFLLFKTLGLQTQAHQNSNQLIAEYLDTEMKYPTITKDDTIDKDSYWSTAKQQYLSNDFDGFLDIMNNKTLSDEQQYYVGLAQGLKSSPNFPVAITQLSAISDESLFKEEANWYLALFYIQENRMKEGKQLLQSIVNTKSWHYNRAVELLEKL